MNLSKEQEKIIEHAVNGENILVDACIGSGKTTTIKAVCNHMPGKKILYLTYNRLLKEDAKETIIVDNTTVTNYHSFAMSMCYKTGKRVNVSESITYCIKNQINIPHYEVLIIDEYQDIDEDISMLLMKIKNANPGIQIIMVGDIAQKIYDWTTLKVVPWSQSFLGDHVELKLTKSFRISKVYGDLISESWDKEINGVNKDFTVSFMDFNRTKDFLSEQSTKDVLCLGQRTGKMSQMLNRLEAEFPELYNKKTTYASIRDTDKGGTINPSRDNAIFTTFDSSKGLEKPVCVVFDYDYHYWAIRYNMPESNPYILRNIFLVAASRAKRHLIFVRESGQDTINLDSFKTLIQKDKQTSLEKFDISDMFDFKYKEDVEKCYTYIKKKEIHTDDHSTININASDCLIDLSPCIGNYQEASFFKHYNLDETIQYLKDKNPDKSFLLDHAKGMDFDRKILAITAFETGQNRYNTQVTSPFIEISEKEAIHDRLSTTFNKHEEVQTPCFLNNKYGIEINGRCDVIKDNKIYELKFVDELSHTNFLQLACYLVAMDIDEGVLWNVKRNQKYLITVKDKTAFVEQVIKTIKKINY